MIAILPEVLALVPKVIALLLEVLPEVMTRKLTEIAGNAVGLASALVPYGG